jgi:hypothetical protein
VSKETGLNRIIIRSGCRCRGGNRSFVDRKPVLFSMEPSSGRGTEPGNRATSRAGARPVPKGSELVIIVSASVLLVVPCIWLPQIESLDLCSHIYNAWLARLIAVQHIPGLWIARQSTNILFDNLLTLLMTSFGPVWAQRILVSAAALLFFWSSFILVAALSDTRPWFLLPCLAVLSYGRIFHYGFFNFYVSLAFAFLALSLFWKQPRWWRILFVLLLGLSWIAHPLPPLLAVAAAAYIYVARKASDQIQLVLLCGVMFFLLLVGLYERIRFPGSSFQHPSLPREFLSLFGWDQVLAFDRPFSILSYRSVELGILFVFLFLLMQKLPKRNFVFIIPMQLYTLACFAAFILPNREFYFPELFRNPLGFIAERFSLLAAVLGCAVVARYHPRPWQRALLLLLAGVFFAVVYQDEHALAQLEARVNQLVSQLPPRQRVSAMLHYPGIEDGFTEDLLDRACVGRCYSYGNYEAPTLQFRIRAQPTNSFILANLDDSNRIAKGTYRVQPRDLPLHQIYPCGPEITDLCIRDLKPGELNGAVPAHLR